MASASGKIRSFILSFGRKCDITIDLELVMGSLHVQCRHFCNVFFMYIIAKHLFDLSQFSRTVCCRKKNGKYKKCSYNSSLGHNC
jgi:hypothetical protein